MKKQIYLLLLFAFCYHNSNAQSTENNAAKNVIYVNAGSVLVYNSVSLNYDLHLLQTESFFLKNYYLNLEAGLFSRNSGFAPGPSADGFRGGLGVIALTGKGDNHFEIGLGASINADTYVDDNDLPDEDEKEVFVLPEIALGYRSQRPDGMMFRAGIGFPHIIYIGLGYSF